MSAQNAIDPEEIAHFAKDSGKWWDENGPFRPLHRLNPVRMAYIRGQICAHFDRPDDDNLTPLKGLRVADIGCGGGLVCEPLARMGAAVTGIDADESAVAVARDHALQGGLAIDYIAGDAASVQDQFDVVLALEIIEHVSDPEIFMASVMRLCRPGGLVICSTLNRTAKSFALGVVAAEYILGWVPRGTHNWRKFVRPSELAALIRGAGAVPLGVRGLVFDPLRNGFGLSDNDLDVNYFMTARKEGAL